MHIGDRVVAPDTGHEALNEWTPGMFGMRMSGNRAQGRLGSQGFEGVTFLRYLSVE